MKVWTLGLVLILAGFLFSAENEACMECHSDPELTTERGGQEISLYVNEKVFASSVHGDVECVSCHADADVEEFPHPEKLAPPNCGDCHDDAQEEYDEGLHGKAYAAGERYAPSCWECHGKHDIFPPGDVRSRVFKMKIPVLCGRCHREGAPVARIYRIPEHNILENYSQSIHGEGLFKKGLIVTAACADCHDAHRILPHTDPRSTIAPENIARTCTRCHSRIEDVHVKIIKGEKWRKDPSSIPTCTDCHIPHKARKESLLLSLSDRSCLLCHGNKEIHKVENGKQVSLYTNKDLLKQSVHREVPCVKCHSDVDASLQRPCATAGKVNCGNCHIDISEQYKNSGHALAKEKGVTEAPDCKTCHGTHGILANTDEKSPTFRANVPALCGGCHRADREIAAMDTLSQHNALTDYSKSIHGQRLAKQGLLPAAICSDCHTSHSVLSHKNPQSSVNPRNIPATCAKCHLGIYKEFANSIHGRQKMGEEKNLPVCTTCHSSHTIQFVGKDKFVVEVTSQCGSCHRDLAETYLETMHGKTYKLGYLKAAKCSDCHTAHNILPPDDPNSSLSIHNIKNTCQKCHEDASERFTGYLTHATHHDRNKYPYLYYTYKAMTFLLIGVFTFFGLHTLLWLPRSIENYRRRKRLHQSRQVKYYIRRFDLSHRITHLFVIISFLSLAITGMMLKFSGMPWAKFMADLIGGVAVAGTIHRIGAIITFGYFFVHLYLIYKRKKASGKSFWQFITGPHSMMFNKKDIQDFIATIKWFLWMGPRPKYGRWTYWEKFDYFAVFWGVAVIGASGLMLWFPEFFTHFLPGWLINVAGIIHSDEALLAAGFIFTIHFFNTHLRPESFPLDKVIFTGIVPLEEYKEDRPAEYEYLKSQDALKKVVVKTTISKKKERFISIMGMTFLTIGVVIILLIIYSMLFGYK